MDPVFESGPAEQNERSKGRVRRSAAPAAQAMDAGSKPPTELVARRAYELFEQRGGEHGQDVNDWLLAERELFDQASEAGMLTRGLNEPAAN